MLSDQNSKMTLVVRPLAKLLFAAQLFIFAVALFAAGRLVIFGVMSVLEIDNVDETSISLLSVVVGLAVATAVLLLKGPTAKRLADETVARIIRFIFINCDRASTGAKRLGLQCLAVTSDFRKIQINHPTQKRLVETLFANIRDEQYINGTFDVVLAPSGFGKTRTATLLAEALVRSEDLCTLANNLYYYDFARGFVVQNKFVRSFGGLSHSGALVIVDNFHLAEPWAIGDITKRLLDVVNTATERHLVIMAQPLENWKLRAGSEVRLLSFAREKQRLHIIDALSKADIAKAQLSKDVLQRVRQFAQYSSSGVASIAEIQSVQVDELSSRHQKRLASKVSDYLFAVNRNDLEPPSQRLVIVAATATALAIFKGGFSMGDFRKAFVKANSRSGLRALWDRIQAPRELRLLSKAGIMPKSSLQGGRFTLHERLAEHLRDTLGQSDSLFEEAFQRALRWRIDESEEAQDPTLKWFAGVELCDNNVIAEHFGSAMADGNLRAMAQRLRRVVPTLDNDLSKFQLGIILDKSGNFSEARGYLGEVASELDNEGFAAQSTLALLEAEHSPDRQAIVEFLGKSDDPRVELSATYWDIHMQAHLGEFAPERFQDLANRLAKTFSTQEIKSDFFLSTLASRVYFDAHRHTFLRRENVVQGILDIEKSALQDVIEGNDPCFKANTILYERAHVLAFVVLPELAIFQNRLSPDQSLGLADVSEEISDLTLRIESEYHKAQDEFSVFGNREQFYLAADILNARIQNPDTKISDLRLALAEYQKFITDADFADLLSYPQIYAFKLAIRSWRDALADPNAYTADVSAVDDFLDEAYRALKMVRSLDKACGNAYGMWRHDLYLALLDALNPSKKQSHKELASKFNALARKAGKLGFVGDQEFLERFVELGQLRISNVLNAILYHPFVHQ